MTELEDGVFATGHFSGVTLTELKGTLAKLVR